MHWTVWNTLPPKKRSQRKSMASKNEDAIVAPKKRTNADQLLTPRKKARGKKAAAEKAPKRVNSLLDPWVQSSANLPPWGDISGRG